MALLGRRADGGGSAAARDTRGGTALPCPHAHVLDAVAVGEGGVLGEEEVVRAACACAFCFRIR